MGNFTATYEMAADADSGSNTVVGSMMASSQSHTCLITEGDKKSYREDDGSNQISYSEFESQLHNGLAPEILNRALPVHTVREQSELETPLSPSQIMQASNLEPQKGRGVKKKIEDQERSQPNDPDPV